MVISDELLMETFIIAIQLHLENDFILLLEKELNERAIFEDIYNIK